MRLRILFDEDEVLMEMKKIVSQKFAIPLRNLTAEYCNDHGNDTDKPSTVVVGELSYEQKMKNQGWR